MTFLACILRGCFSLDYNYIDTSILAPFKIAVNLQTDGKSSILKNTAYSPQHRSKYCSGIISQIVVIKTIDNPK